MSQSAVVGKRVHASRTLPTREAWLLGLVNALRPFYGRHKAALPTRVRISVGWPSTSATTARTRRIYPHAALTAGGGPGRTAWTRMLKLTCRPVGIPSAPRANG